MLGSEKPDKEMYFGKLNLLNSTGQIFFALSLTAIHISGLVDFEWVVTAKAVYLTRLLVGTLQFTLK